MQEPRLKTAPNPVVTLKNPHGGAAVEIGTPGVVLMGVINRSPESANKDVFASSPEAALKLARRFTGSGVQVIDVGGQSTNYENQRVSVDEELERVVPTVDRLAHEGFVVSVDTFRAEVAAEAIGVGASLLNDTAGLVDPSMVEVVATTGIPAVLMHLEADQPLDVDGYDDAVGKPERIANRLGERLTDLGGRGIEDLILDPGTGISYRSDYDRYSQSQFEIAENLDHLTALGVPVMYAVPRKADRYRNVALAALAMASGATMLRIHDVEMIGDVAWLMRRIDDKPEVTS